jgi:hypothetical protein
VRTTYMEVGRIVNRARDKRQSTVEQYVRAFECRRTRCTQQYGRNQRASRELFVAYVTLSAHKFHMRIVSAICVYVPVVLVASAAVLSSVELICDDVYWMIRRECVIPNPPVSRFVSNCLAIS